MGDIAACCPEKVSRDMGYRSESIARTRDVGPLIIGRGIGVRVKGVTGRDAIVAQQFPTGNAIVPRKSWLPSTFPLFFRV